MSEADSLRAEWYARLAADGFRDLEQRKNPDGALSGAAGGAPSSRVIESRAEYYALARAALHDERLPACWSAGRAREVLELHVEGLGYRAIRSRLRCRRSTVEETVDAFAKWIGTRLGRVKKGGRPPAGAVSRGNDSRVRSTRLIESEDDALLSISRALGIPPGEALREVIKAAGAVLSTKLIR